MDVTNVVLPNINRDCVDLNYVQVPGTDLTCAAIQ